MNFFKPYCRGVSEWRTECLPSDTYVRFGLTRAAKGCNPSLITRPLLRSYGTAPSWGVGAWLLHKCQPISLRALLHRTSIFIPSSLLILIEFPLSWYSSPFLPRRHRRDLNSGEVACPEGFYHRSNSKVMFYPTESTVTIPTVKCT